MPKAPCHPGHNQPDALIDPNTSVDGNVFYQCQVCNKLYGPYTPGGQLSAVLTALTGQKPNPGVQSEHQSLYGTNQNQQARQQYQDNMLGQIPQGIDDQLAKQMANTLSNQQQVQQGRQVDTQKAQEWQRLREDGYNDQQISEHFAKGDAKKATQQQTLQIHLPPGVAPLAPTVPQPPQVPAPAKEPVVNRTVGKPRKRTKEELAKMKAMTFRMNEDKKKEFMADCKANGQSFQERMEEWVNLYLQGKQ